MIRTAVAALIAAAALILSQRAPAQPAAQAAAAPFPHPTLPHVSTRYTILPLGDSITLGVASTSGTGYRGPLAALAPAIVFTGSQGTPPLLHEGHSGWRIDQLAAIAQTTMATYRPAYVLLHAGTNDTVQGYTAASMLTSMAQLLDTLAAAQVLLALIPITPYATAAQQAQEQAYDDGLPALAATRPTVRIVDMRATEISADGVHPDDAGYEQMAAVWAAALPEAKAQ